MINSELMQCGNYSPDCLVYFTQARIKNVRCTGKAKWIVTVNPPNSERSGKIRLCDLCNRFDYLTFPREKLGDYDGRV